MRFVLALTVTLLLLPATSEAQSYPVLSGTYMSAKQRPRVFMTPGSIAALVARINIPNSFSQQQFAKLSGLVKTTLAAHVDWDAAYSGCDLDTYLHGFSIVTTRGYPDEIRSADQLKAAMGVKPTEPQSVGPNHREYFQNANPIRATTVRGCRKCVPLKVDRKL